MKPYDRKTEKQLNQNQHEAFFDFLDFVELWEDVKLFERIAWRKKVNTILNGHLIYSFSNGLILDNIVDYIVGKYATSDVLGDECGWSFYNQYSAEKRLHEELLLLGEAFRYYQIITGEKV
tara:strand:+ start:803 stop:1165 length:363 start_codon:yes stop_codon:yes gene_type:complete